MADRPLEGAEAKLGRAREHLQRLSRESAEFLKDDPYRVVADFNAQTGWWVVKARIIEHAPVELSVTVGEFAYECISALNHIAWKLAARKRGSRKVEGKKLREQIQYPIALTPSDFPNKALIRGAHVSKAAVAILSELQPYHRWNGAARAKSHSLWVLKEIADSDKHRVVAPRWGSLDLAKLRVIWDEKVAKEPRGRYIPRSRRTLRDGAQLQWIRFGVGNDKANVRVEGDPSPEIAFGAGDFLVSPRELDNALAYTDRAIKRLAMLFG